ncbi:hypothetical protein [Nocardia sp. MW-W600-9]
MIFDAQPGSDLTSILEQFEGLRHILLRHWDVGRNDATQNRVPDNIEPEVAAGELDAALDQLDPSTTPARDAKHFRGIIAARKKVAEAEAELRAAVKAARDAGDSWTVIGAALDTSRQAAFQRFGKD